MKSGGKAIATLVISLALTTYALAGVMHTDGSPTPAPTPTPTANGEMHTDATGGEMHTGEAESVSDAIDTSTEAALTLLQSLLTLL